MAAKLDENDPDVCLKCPSTCCYNYSLHMNRPRTEDEIANLRWQLHFDNIEYFIKSHQWYMLIKSRCMFLDKKNLCSNHENRPAICRRHNPPNCEMFGHGAWYDVILKIPKDLDEFIAKEKAKKKRQRKKYLKKKK